MLLLLLLWLVKIKQQIRPKQMSDMSNAILHSKFLAEPKCRESKRGSGTSKHQVILEIGSATLTGHQRISKGTAMTLCLAQAARQAPPGATLSLWHVPITRESCLRGRRKRSRAFLVFPHSKEYFTTKEAVLISFSKRKCNLYCPAN